MRQTLALFFKPARTVHKRWSVQLTLLRAESLLGVNRCPTDHHL